MVTFLINVKSSAALPLEMLRAQLMSCASVRGARILVGLSDSCIPVERLVADCAANSDLRDRVSVRILQDVSLYDSWNRALPHCATDRVVFLGLGDVVLNSRYFEKVSALTGIDVVFSRVLIYDAAGDRVFGRRFNLVAHLVKQFVAFVGAVWSTELLRRYPFDLSYHVAGDYEYLLRTGRHLRAAYYPIVSVAMPAGGLSERAAHCARAEMARARRAFVLGVR